jgi:hypothetical protein
MAGEFKLTCKGLAEDYSLTNPEGCQSPAAKVVEHPEGCSFPLCAACAKRLHERWDKQIGNTKTRPVKALDAPGGFW